MFSSMKIARLAGIVVQIHWTFWLLPLWILFTGSDDALFPMWMQLGVLTALFGCVVLHELGHALAAKQFGIRTRNITLTPLGGIAQLERMTHKPWEEFCIAVAGPAVNVAIAFVLGLALAFGQALGLNLEASALMRFLGVLLMVNVAMIVFNMIPAFPMDGGRVLRSILANSMGLVEGTRVAVAVGIVAAVGMGLAGAVLLGNPFLILIAVFVIFTGLQELRTLEMEQAEANDELATPKQARAMHVTLCVWDPQRQQWVRHTFDEPMSFSR